MSNTPLSDEKKWSIVALNREHRTPSYIAENLGICRGTVYKYIKKFEETGKLDVLPRSGRPPVSTNREDNMLYRMVRKSPTKSLNQLVSDWGVGSRQTISKRLIEKGLLSHKMVEKPVLTKKSQQSRLEWCKERASWNFDKWSTVAFSDESNFTLMNRKTSVFCRRYKHEKYENQFLKRKMQGGAGSIGVWGVFNFFGMGPIQAYSNRMNSANYIDILSEHLIPWKEI